MMCVSWHKDFWIIGTNVDKMGLTLDVAVATHGKDGIRRVEKMLLPPQDGVRYVVSWQDHEDAPVPLSMLGRNDVEVWRLDVGGVSNNRNNATDHCLADIVVASDDDLVYEKNAFKKIVNAFENDPGLDLATFRVKFYKDKPYPADGTTLTVPFPKNYWVSCVEIAFRRERMGDIRFNPLLGPGAPELICGEDEMFVIDAVRGGKNCRHVAELICSHPHPSTGARVSEGILKSSGYLIHNVYPSSCILRILLKAYRLKRQKKCGLLFAIRNMLAGSRVVI